MRRGEFVKAKALLLFILFACAPTLCMFGQVNCLTSTKLVCQLPVSALTLAYNTVGNASSGTVFTLAEQQALPINQAIATQLTQLPIPSATVGVVSLNKKGSEVGVPFENLGPILTDRPDTVGQGHIFMGFSYQHFNFNALDGVNLASLPVSLVFSPTTGQTFYGAEVNKVGFQLDQYVGIATFGITKKTDISVVVPINSVSAKVTTSGFQAYLYNSATGTYGTISTPTSSVPSSGSASGLGDVTVGVKQLLVGGGGSRGAVATGLTIRFPSGDALSYLGSGAWGGNVYGLFEYRARLAPHFKVAYQWNGNSQVMDLLNAPHAQLPGGLQYAGGVDYKVARPLTLTVDVLGSQFVNTPSFNVSTLTLPTATSGLAPSVSSIPFTSSLNNTYTSANFSGGLKWSPAPHLLLYGNVMMAINNVGLRSDPVPLFGIAYNFKAGK
jgi:hypothetical protein